MPPKIQYEIRRGIDDKIDYNMDGKIDKYDDIVIKYINGKEVERRPLNAKVEKQIEKALKAPAPKSAAPGRRIVYKRTPHDPPPVVVKDNTNFGQYVKAGAGLTVGQMAVQGIANALGGLFSSDE